MNKEKLLELAEENMCIDNNVLYFSDTYKAEIVHQSLAAILTTLAEMEKTND